ncbi:unnamed protein product [Vitrella brassicaformis CCMP3155]|uniref:Transmembrane protein n=1 Tax=Vitrella brassicaformis (strain CCMP3155) TaxID=1169540 RepID=A0A0G4EQG2_VITBC|nr:unnamed protein product [Vitrella brassicaformis CCMP3155]|eukprot:CEM00040.1 unnamed protein product [Vitrella brassicaformis CCMP3155]
MGQTESRASTDGSASGASDAAAARPPGNGLQDVVKDVVEGSLHEINDVIQLFESILPQQAQAAAHETAKKDEAPAAHADTPKDEPQVVRSPAGESGEEGREEVRGLAHVPPRPQQERTCRPQQMVERQGAWSREKKELQKRVERLLRDRKKLSKEVDDCKSRIDELEAQKKKAIRGMIISGVVGGMGMTSLLFWASGVKIESSRHKAQYNRAEKELRTERERREKAERAQRHYQSKCIHLTRGDPDVPLPATDSLPSPSITPTSTTITTAAPVLPSGVDVASTLKEGPPAEGWSQAEMAALYRAGLSREDLRKMDEKSETDRQQQQLNEDKGAISSDEEGAEMMHEGEGEGEELEVRLADEEIDRIAAALSSRLADKLQVDIDPSKVMALRAVPYPKSTAHYRLANQAAVIDRLQAKLAQVRKQKMEQGVELKLYRQGNIQPLVDTTAYATRRRTHNAAFAKASTGSGTSRGGLLLFGVVMAGVGFATCWVMEEGALFGEWGECPPVRFPSFNLKGLSLGAAPQVFDRS